MPWRSQPDLLALVSALLISTVSAFVSISQRITRGHPASVLWVISEFSAALLAGYLTYDAYPVLDPHLPDWMTPLMAVALAAHMGGRLIQGAENAVYKKLDLDRRNKPVEVEPE